MSRQTDYREEYDKQAKKLCLLGAVDKDLADFFDVCEATINNWKKDHPSFLESIKEGKSVADAKVAQSLYQRAKGYYHAEDKIFNGGFDEDGSQREPVVVPTVKHYPPDTTACIFWLKNRKPEAWRDKQEIDQNQNITVEVVQYGEDN